MARIKYSGLIDEINGSIGGTTFQRNRYGYTIKRKPAGKKSGTPSQNQRRSLLYKVQQDWIGLSDANRSNWNTYASTFPTPTRLNPNVFLNGVNLFERYNLLRLLSLSSILANPSGAQQTLSFDGFVISEGEGTFGVNVDFTVSGGLWQSLVFLSRPVSPTSALKKNILRFIVGDTFSSDDYQDFIPNYSNVFGFQPVAGDYLQYRWVMLNTSNGQIFDTGVQLTQIDAV